jgi:hypothetical protein
VKILWLYDDYVFGLGTFVAPKEATQLYVMFNVISPLGGYVTPSNKLPLVLLSFIFLVEKTYTNGDKFLYDKTELNECCSNILSINIKS